MSESSRAEDLRQRLEAAGVHLSEDDFALLLPLWQARDRSWQRLKQEDLGSTPPSAVFAPESSNDSP